MTRVLRALAVAILALMLTTGDARADGDPASDFLIVESVFYPYPTVSPALRHRLDAEAAAAVRVHFPIKVALIASASDLGAIEALFGHAQRYATFLDQEIGYVGSAHPPLLVVMPNGYGVAGLAPQVVRAVASLRRPAGSSSDDLARAAIAALPALAAAGGHPITGALTAAVRGRGSGPSTLLVVLIALAAVASAGAVVAVRLWRRRR